MKDRMHRFWNTVNICIKVFVYLCFLIAAFGFACLFLEWNPFGDTVTMFCVYVGGWVFLGVLIWGWRSGLKGMKIKRQALIDLARAMNLTFNGARGGSRWRDVYGDVMGECFGTVRGLRVSVLHVPEYKQDGLAVRIESAQSSHGNSVSSFASGDIVLSIKLHIFSTPDAAHVIKFKSAALRFVTVSTNSEGPVRKIFEMMDIEQRIQAVIRPFAPFQLSVAQGNLEFQQVSFPDDLGALKATVNLLIDLLEHCNRESGAR